MNSSDYILKLTKDPEDPIVLRFFEEYTNMFRSSGQETLDGFRSGLAMNTSHFQDQYGPSCEYIAIFENEKGETIAGFNFICFPMKIISNLVTVHSIYVFVLPKLRKNGLLYNMYKVMGNTARQYAEGEGFKDSEVLFFGEQNDPYKMTKKARYDDSKSALIDQFERITIWKRLCARVVVFEYTQPPLSLVGKADKGLFLRVIFEDEFHTNYKEHIRLLDPEILIKHLTRFFFFPILKTRGKLEDLDVKNQLQVLQQMISNKEMIQTLPIPDVKILPPFANSIVEAIHHVQI